MGWDVAGWQSSVQLKTLDSMLPNCKGVAGGEEDTSGFCLKKMHVYFFPSAFK